MSALLASTLFVCFSIDIDDVSGRTSYAAGVLLANVGIKYSVAERLPVLPYLTFLDGVCCQYLLCN